MKVLLMAAKSEFALITFSHMCFSNDSSESIVTPMSFYSLQYILIIFSRSYFKYLENRNDPDLVHAFLKKWWVESDILKKITPCKALGPKYGQSL
jgi:hypothetical protein